MSHSKWKNTTENILRLVPSESSTEVEKWEMVFSSWNYFYLGNVCEETFMYFRAEFNNFDWKKCSGKYEVIEYVISFLSSNYDIVHSNKNILNCHKTLFLGFSVRKIYALEMKFYGVSVSEQEKAVWIMPWERWKLTQFNWIL